MSARNAEPVAFTERPARRPRAPADHNYREVNIINLKFAHGGATPLFVSVRTAMSQDAQEPAQQDPTADLEQQAPRLLHCSLEALRRVGSKGH